MREALQRYGHDQPSVFYTDNMADKDFLERCFPSLRENLVPVEKYSHLNRLCIPDDVQISVKKSVTAIDDAMRTVLDLLPDDDKPGLVVIGLDAEWNVEMSQHGYVTGRGQTAVLQIAHGTEIYILQVKSFGFWHLSKIHKHCLDRTHAFWEATAASTAAGSLKSENN